MRINSFVPLGGKWKVVSVFGYSTKGVPGIEIKGLGKRSSLLKEKLIYLTRTNRIKIPLRRYVICVDLPRESKIEADSYQWLELPVLLIFWQMLEILPISKLEDCFAAGAISTTGKVRHLSVKSQYLRRLSEVLDETHKIKMKYLAPEGTGKIKDLAMIPLERLFEGKQVYFKISTGL